ncbi:MAG: phospholipid carrier-dependent glycosyltransferase [Proteobacteria bacterium]|nr:phospholipid carrier-dependent glycosyltransferase [Pseudomonadota bacterium]
MPTMIRPKTHHQFRFVLMVCFVLMVGRLLYNYADLYDLYADEAQYWVWSKDVAWGYYSKPPVIAWLIYSTATWCGDSAFCIKFSSPILHFLTSLIVYAIGARLFRDPKIATWSAITYATLPAVTVSASIISTDVPLLFFWAMATYFFIRGMQDFHINWWVLMGIAIGFGMLSKYNMIMFFPSLVLYFLMSKNNRVYLISLKLWLSAAIAGLIYIPNFLWNARNRFVSYEHTKANANIHSLTLYPKELLEFLGSQLGVFGPIVFLVLLYILIFKLPRLFKRDENRMLIAFIIPMLFTILTVSILSRAHANWAAPIYIPATVLVVSWLIQSNKTFILYLSLFLHITATLVFYNFDPTVKALGIQLNHKTDPFRRIRGWDKIGEEVKHYQSEYQDAQLLSNERKIVATLMYELRDAKGHPAKVYKWNADHKTQDHFDLTRDAIHAPGKNFLLVTRSDREDVAKIEQYFESSDMVGVAEVPLYPGYKLHYGIYYLQGFKGY